MAGRDRCGIVGCEAVRLLVAAMVLNVVIAAVGVGIGLLYRKPKPDESVQAAQNPSA